MLPMGLLSEKIDRDMRALALKCHSYVVEGHITRPAFARRAGLSNTLLAGIERPDFTASLRTLRALEKVIPVDWFPGQGLSVEPRGLNLNPYVRRSTRSSSDSLSSRKFYFETGAIDAVDPFEIGRIRAALDQWSDHQGRLREEKVNRTVLKALSGAAVHVLDAEEPSPSGFRYQLWDTGTGYKGGADFSGLTVADVSDPSLRDCTFEDFLTARELNWPSFAAIERNFVGWETRRFLRYVHPIIGLEKHRKLLIFCRPFDFHA